MRIVQEMLLERGEKLKLDTATNMARTYEATILHIEWLTLEKQQDTKILSRAARKETQRTVEENTLEKQNTNILLLVLNSASCVIKLITGSGYAVQKANQTPAPNHKSKQHQSHGHIKGPYSQVSQGEPHRQVRGRSSSAQHRGQLTHLFDA